MPPRGCAMGSREPESPRPKMDDEAYEELDRQLTDAEAKGKQLTAKGRELTKAGQFITDLSQATKGVIEVHRPPTNVELLINDWSATNEVVDHALASLGKVELSSITSASGTAAYTSSDSYQTTIVLGAVPAYARPIVIERINALNEVIGRSVEAAEVADLLRKFGFDQAPRGKASAFELFNTAHSAFEGPVTEDNPVSTSLIPIRSALNVVIAELLRRRPKQEPAKNEWAKIQSIGRQLKSESVPNKIVDTWAYQWGQLLDRYLSPAKDQSLDRSEWQHRLQQATLFLKSLLNGIDPTKLRP